MTDMFALVVFLALIGLAGGLIMLCDRLGSRP